MPRPDRRTACKRFLLREIAGIMRTLLPTASEAVSDWKQVRFFMPFELAIDPSTLIILAVVAFSPVSSTPSPAAALLTIPALLTAGSRRTWRWYQQAELDLRCGDRQLHLLPAQAVPSREVAQRSARHRDRRRHRRLGGSPAARRVAEPDAPGGGIHLRPLHALGGTPKAPLDADAPLGRSASGRRASPWASRRRGPGTGAFWTVSSLLMYPLDLVRASGGAEHEPSAT